MDNQTATFRVAHSQSQLALQTGRRCRHQFDSVI